MWQQCLELTCSCWHDIPCYRIPLCHYSAPVTAPFLPPSLVTVSIYGYVLTSTAFIHWLFHPLNASCLGAVWICPTHASNFMITWTSNLLNSSFYIYCFKTKFFIEQELVGFNVTIESISSHTVSADKIKTKLFPDDFWLKK